MKKLTALILLLLVQVVQSNAQTVGNNQRLSMQNTSVINSFFSLEAIATTIESMELQSGDIKILTENNSVDFKLKFYTNGLYSNYIIIDQWGNRKSFVHSNSEQTYSITVNLSGNSGYERLEFWFKDNGTEFLQGFVTIDVEKVTKPSTPTSLTGSRTGNGSSINLSWSLPNSSRVDGVKIQRKSGSSWVTEKTINSAATSTTLTGQSTSSITYRVIAFNDQGDSDPSSTKVIAALSVPGQPTGVSASRTSSTAAKISWSLSGTVSTVQVQYRVSGASWSTKTISSRATSTTLSNLSVAKSYQFRVRAGNAKGYSSYSSTATLPSVPLNAPGDLVVFRPYYYNLKWSDPNSSYITGKIEIQKGGYYGSPDAFYTIATINNIHATSHYLGSTLPTSKYRLKFTDSTGRVKYSNVFDPALKAPSDLEVFKPYYYNLRWSDPNEDFLSGKIEVQKGGYWGSPDAFYTIATLTNIHTTSHYIGSSAPSNKYRLKFTDSAGNVKYSNVVDPALKAPDDLVVFRPYYYNLKWTDPNLSYVSGRIEIQKGGYYGYPDAFYTIATLTNIHTTSYYIGSTVPTEKYRLKFIDSSGNTAYSNEASYSSGRVTSEGLIEEADISNEAGFQIYPIPTEETLYLSSSTELAYEIFDGTGRIWKNGSVETNDLNQNIMIDVHELKPGIYFIKAGEISKKFIIK